MCSLLHPEFIFDQDKGKSFECAFNFYWEKLYNQALRKLNNQELAEDIVQETFVAAWNNGSILERRDELQAYLYGVLRYKILDLFRKDEMHLRYANGIATSTDSFASAADENLLTRELQQIITDELSKMPDRMLEIYELKRTHNLSISEISLKLGISEQTIKNQVYRASERLKKRLIEYDVSLMRTGLVLYFFMRFFKN